MIHSRPDAAGVDADVAILGGGLSGGLCALALAEHAPHLRVALIEQGHRLAGNHTWCCHANDLESASEPSLGIWFSPLVAHRWSRYQVTFPDFDRTICGEYLCIPSDALERALTRVMARPGNKLLLGERVRRASSDEVLLESGLRLRARLVLDARGSQARTGGTGFQKFLGWEIETEAPAPSLGRFPTLMDATVQQLDGFRFVYVLPMSPARFLVEDTYFARDAELRREQIAARLRAYLEGRGVERYEVVREESGVLPMPWVAGPDLRDTTSAAVAIGYRAGLFHPATGYSLGLAAQSADRIARAAGTTGSLRTATSAAVAKLHAEIDDDVRFAHVLNLLAFRAIPGSWLRSLVFSAVYRLPPDLLQRFYAVRTSVRDRLALLGAVARVPWLRPSWSSTHLNGEMS
jgi:lycopene beta-cyclase